MSCGRRTAALVLFTAVSPWLAACGGEPQEATPTPVVIPGSTVTIGTESTSPSNPTPSDPAPSSPASSSQPTTDATSAPAGSISTVTDLFARIGGAMGQYDAVHTSSGVGAATSRESDYQFLGGGDDYVARLAADSAPASEIRRVGGVLYVQRGSSRPWATYEAGSAAGDEGRLLDEFVATDFLGDLRAELDNATDFAAPGGPTDIDGTTVETFTYSVDIQYVLPGDPVPGDPEGTFEVAFSIAADTGLPVRIERSLAAGGNAIRVDYSGWGDPVDVEVPDVG